MTRSIMNGSQSSHGGIQDSIGRWRMALLIVATISFVTLTVDAADDSKPLERFSISVMGDVPYAPAEVVSLPQQLIDVPKQSVFVVHLGDIKTGRSECVEPVYELVSGILSKSAQQLFIIPGDNEWNDCANPNEAWTLWQKYFRRFDQKWKSNLKVERQAERDENFAFVHSNVLFVGINLVGGRVHDPNEWKRRHAENLDWIRRYLERERNSVTSAVIFAHAHPTAHHQDFMDPFFDVATAFEKPILFIHGDGHKWIHDNPYQAKNIVRVQVDQGGIAPPLTVSFTEDPRNPFVLDRRKPSVSQEP
ncbi:hypothetical protein [Schlesneria paludicola]|uniref:hypothetical protein n=1 Tax=Schlesneria paludicola TaxID=360056 RepID=UPI0012F91124|nr:hypothetical protein [Schlesneria paludicola]